MEKNGKALLRASVAGLMAAAGMAVTGSSAHAEPGQAAAKPVHCYGINKCQGVGACGGKGHACAGTNACNGQGYLDLPEETCLKIEGGRLTEDAEPQAS